MSYDIKDAKQAFVGAIVASLLVVLIRSESIIINPTTGLWIGLIWIYIVTKPYITKRFETKVHTFWNVIVTLSVTTILSLAFNLVTMEQIQSFQFFGSTPWVIMMIALPTATFWDKLNITNQYHRWYFRRRR